MCSEAWGEVALFRGALERAATHEVGKALSLEEAVAEALSADGENS